MFPGPRDQSTALGRALRIASALRAKAEVFTSGLGSPKIKSAMPLRTLLLAIVVGLATGCGGGATTSSTSSDPELTSAKKDLQLAYRVADRARLHDLRCSGDISPACHHPRWYPAADSVAAAVGTQKLHRLTVAFVDASDVVRRGVTYIVKTRRKSLVLAQKTNGGATLVLHGSPSGSSFTQVAASDWIASHASTITLARPKISVPDVTGMSLKSAQRTLQKAKLGWSFSSKPGEGSSGSRIVRAQNPSPGSRWYQWKPVELYFHRK
jgi:PASTA domain